MGFLNSILLFGAAAFAIPLVIHLLRKRKVQEVHWGANFLLEEIQASRRRAPQWHRLLLLLIRILIPILLALALARPVMKAISSGVGDGDPGSHVIVLDTSPSMIPLEGSAGAGDADTAGGATKLSLSHPALRAVHDVVDGLPKGSQVTVIGGDGGDPLGAGSLSGDTARITRALSSGRVVRGGKFDPGTVARRSAELLGGAAHPSRSILVVSDFQTSDWRGGAARSLRNLSESGDEFAPQVRLMKIDPGAATRRVGISHVSTAGLIAVKAQPVAFRAVVENPTLVDWSGQLRVMNGSNELEAITANVVAGTRREFAITAKLPDTGFQGLRVTLAPDPGGWGAEAPIVLAVREPIPVRLIDGQPGHRPFDGETGFLDVALQPFAATSSEGDLFRVQQTHDRNISEHMLRGVDVLVLANVEELNPGHMRHLRNWVELGGGLLILPGDNCNPGFYNGFPLTAKEGVFPATMGRIKPAPEGLSRPDSPPYAHPVLSYFNELGGEGLDGFGFTHHYPLTPVGDPSDAASPRTILRVGGADPLFVEGRIGAGKVIMASVPADADWGGWPTQPAYLPLMQRLVAYLSKTASSGLGIELGQTFRFPLDGFSDGGRVIVLRPDGEEETVKIEKPERREYPSLFSYGPCRVPGIYHVVSEDDGAAVLAFACSVPTSELKAETMDDDAFAELGEQSGGETVDNATSFLSLDTLARIGREIWRPLVCAVLALLFLEMLVAQATGGNTGKSAGRKGGSA